jgi:hypothetical protein
MEKPVQISLFDYLEELEEKDKEVEIEGPINPKVSLKEMKLRLSYGDLVLLVAMLRDYVKGLDEIKEGDIQWEVYYRNKFWDMAEKISDQIGYDYDEALKKCMKKQEKESDIGEDALILALKKTKALKKELEQAAEQEAEQKEVEVIEE